MTWAFGIVLTLVGILGFVPGITTSDGLLLGIFSVDSMHNIIHLLTGIIGILAALGAGTYACLYFKVFGVVYALVAILGFAMGGVVLGMMMNMADNLLHVVIAAVALWIGFGMKDSAMPMGMGSSATAM